MLVRIVSPYFVAGYDTASGVIAPIIKYMKGWTVTKIKDYCKRKKWKVQVI